MGYCLGKPLLDYFGNGTENHDSPVWTPPVKDTSDISAETPNETEVTTSGETPDTTTAPPEVTKNRYAVSIPASALLNSSSLSAYAAKASSEGYTAATVYLKDSSGYLRYASEIESLKESEAVVGTLSVKEIFSVLNQNGLTPTAVVSVLKDNMGCAENPDMSYKVIDEDNISWLDYTTESPVRWANPESTATVDYNKAIIDEIRMAGFNEILLSDVIYPDFKDYDRKFIDGRYFSAERYRYLMSVKFEGTGLTVNAEDIILNSYSNTAEILKNRNELSGVTVGLIIKRGAFSAENGYPADSAALIEDVMSQVSVLNPNIKFIPVIESKGFSPSEISAMREKAEDMGYTDLFIW